MRLEQRFYWHIEPIRTGDGVIIGYEVIRNYTYYSKRYDRYVKLKMTDKPYDGATWARDIVSFGWPIHDVLCRDGVFADGTKCTNWQASQILQDILKAENRWFRAHTWFWATLFFGGGKARKNGMFWLN